MSILVSILALGALQSGPAPTLERLKSDAPILVSELPQLQAALASPNAEVQRNALRFWATRGREAWDALYGVLKEEEPIPYTRLETFSQSVVRSLDRAIDSPDPEIRREALRTVCALGYPASDLLEQGFRCGNTTDLTFGEPSGRTLAKRVPGNPTLAMELVNDPEPTVVFNALRHLAPEHKSALQPAVKRLLASRDKLMRAVGLSELETASDRDVFRWIAPLIDDSEEDVGEYASNLFIAKIKDPGASFLNRGAWSPKVRRAIARRIGYRDEPGRESMLFAMLQDPSGEVRAEAFELLLRGASSKPSPLSEPQVRQLLQDPYGGVRAVALRDLFERKAPDILELQRTGLTDPSESVRDTAAWCSMRNFDLSLTPAVVKYLEMANDSSWMLGSYFSDPANDPYLDGWLESEFVNVRRTAALAMSIEKDRERFLPRLLRVARDSDPEVLRYAIRELGTCGGAEAAAAIRAIGSRSTGDQLLLVLSALGKTKDRESIEFLKRHVASSDKAVSKAAGRALRQLTDSLIPPE